MAIILLRWSALLHGGTTPTAVYVARRRGRRTLLQVSPAINCTPPASVLPHTRTAQRLITATLHPPRHVLSVSQRALEVVSVGGRHRKEHRPDAGKCARNAQSALLNTPQRREQQQRTHQSAQSATLAGRLSLYVVLL
jgi:hypothetical protein